MKLGEKGYTLVELLVVITIIAVASSAAAGGIFQIIRNTERNSNYMTAILQMQNAGNRISYDAQMAQGVTADNLMPPDFLLLSWIDVNTGDEYQVTYTLTDMPDSAFKELRRNQSINGSANTPSLVAQYIDAGPEKTRCELTSGVLTFTVTATVGRGATMVSETRIYRIAPRPC